MSCFSKNTAHSPLNFLFSLARVTASVPRLISVLIFSLTLFSIIFVYNKTNADALRLPTEHGVLFLRSYN